MSLVQSTPPAVAAVPPQDDDRPPAAVVRRPRRPVTPYLLLIPATAVVVVAVGYPLVQLVTMSFQEFGRAQAFGQPAPFVGLQNYRDVLTDSEFWTVLGRSVAFCAVNVVLVLVIGTLVALLMQRVATPLRILMSFGLLVAWAMPALTSVIVWGWMFDTQYGVVNYVLTAMSGSDFTGHSWLIEPLSFFAVATIILTWQGVPFVAFTVYAGLQLVPDEVIEAAQLDGAGAAQRFRHVVLPHLKPVLVLLTVLSIIWDLRVFTQIFALQGIGGIRAETSTIGVYIYETSLKSGDYGTGGAIAMVLVVLVLSISWVWVRQTLKEDAQ